MAFLKSIILVFIVFCFIETIQFGWNVDGARLNCPQNERNALLSFKQGLIDQTNRLSSWVGQDCCKWKGVSCDNFTGHVVKLDLRNPFPFDLDSFYHSFGYDKTYSEACLVAVGEVNSSLLELKHLNYLDLSWNNFSGIAIPKFFGLFHELTYLNLSSALFGGNVPHHLGNLSTLHSLDLGTQNIFLFSYYDNIPSLVVNTLHWTSSLVSLKHLVMSGIDLSNIPLDSFQAVALFSSLLELHFSHCSLENIPLFHSTLKNFTSLTILDLSWNYLQGPIPSAIRNMTSLKVLQLSDNLFNNSSVLDLTSLHILDLSYNNFQGPIPSAIRNMTLLKNQLSGEIPNWYYLNMSNSNISDSIPNWFENLTFLEYLDLSGNQMYGKVPNFISPNIVELYLSSNRFEGSFPQFHSSLRYLDLSDNIISGSIPTDIGYRLPNLELLLLSNNSINGTIPSSLCKMLSLRYLDFSKNHLSGVLPNCLGDLQRVEVIDLTSNNLSGTIQRSFCHQSEYLTSLHLSKNNFQGEFPSGLQNCTSLSILDVSDNKFSGEIPTWIGQNLYSLRIMKLSSNKYNGSLSPKLCHLNQLQVLDVAGNNLSGNIPHCFGNFNHMLFNQTNFSRFSSEGGNYQDKLSQ
ncbi:hypothetical protein AQUCO_150400001v1, partial [Aquilegia coerulea]